jgi:hypothetical protein
VQFIPEQPPKGKGERVALGKGTAAQGHAPLPTIVQQYRARVPSHILECPVATDVATGAAAGGYAKTNAGGVRTGDLRTTSAPQRLPSASRRQQGSDDGGGGVQGSAGELVEVLGLRQKSHSFTCPGSPGLM